MNANVVELKDADFKDAINKDKPILVDFWAPSCPPCRKQGPVIDEMANKYSDKITFAKLNTEDNTMFLEEYSIMSIPTLLLFKNGKMIERFDALHDERMLTEALSKYLK